jgi:Rieske Fe-S protein
LQQQQEQQRQQELLRQQQQQEELMRAMNKRVARPEAPRAAAVEIAATQPICKHFGCLMPGKGKDGRCRMHAQGD